MNLSSENINELAMALSKAQGAITSAKKDAVNPFFKSKYATLGSVWDSCREQLSKNNLAVIQSTQPENDQLMMITTLMHSSGQWIKSIMPVIALKSTPQALGSAMSYIRRYSLSSMIGICSEDDDANEAQTAHSETKTVPFVLKNQEKTKPAIISHEQLNNLINLLAECSPEYNKCVQNFLKGASIESIASLPVDTYSRLFKAATDKKNEYAPMLAEKQRLESITAEYEVVNE